jgi:hypothetical protein
MRIQNTPGATSASTLCSKLVNSRKGDFYWLIPSLAHFFLSLVTIGMCQVLFYPHSKCVVSCSMRSLNMAGAALFYHVGIESNKTGLHYVKIVALALF